MAASCWLRPQRRRMLTSWPAMARWLPFRLGPRSQLVFAKCLVVLLTYPDIAYVRNPARPRLTLAGNPVGKILALVEAGHGHSFTG